MPMQLDMHRTRRDLVRGVGPRSDRSDCIVKTGWSSTVPVASGVAKQGGGHELRNELGEP